MAKYLKPRRGSKESAYSQNIDLLKGEIRYALSVAKGSA